MRNNNKKMRAGNSAGKSKLAAKLRWILLLVVVGASVGMFLFSRSRVSGSDDSEKDSTIFAATRGDLTISVTESGDIKAMKSVDILSKVEGKTTIISIVDEGTYITPEDVNNGKVLVELDSSEIKQKLTQQEITYLGVQASYTEARESLEIQKKQNDSDIQAGEMTARFALMDFRKYLGEVLSGKFISQVSAAGSEHEAIAAIVDDPNDERNLGGEALQKLRELDDNITLAKEKLARARNQLKGTQRLYDANYVSAIELEGDKLEAKSLDIQERRAKTAKDLFVRYEFPKEVERLFSDYREANRELDRTKARARSKLAQAEAKLRSEEARYLLEEERLEKWRKQLEACVIKAPAPGQVVYASSTDRWARQRGRMIEIGAEVQERQRIISIPDTSQMKVEIKIHETWVDKVQVGQQAIITVAAFPDEAFTGKVLKKAPLADPEEWLNPDLKVYSTDVNIAGTHESIKTGMTAKVEVIIEKLHDVLSVPIQAVTSVQGSKVCYVLTGAGPQKRQVETGLFNDNFVEIKSGLSEGEKVLLSPQRLAKQSE
jgi:HlyD family secretion protein